MTQTSDEAKANLIHQLHIAVDALTDASIKIVDIYQGSKPHLAKAREASGAAKVALSWIKDIQDEKKL